MALTNIFGGWPWARRRNEGMPGTVNRPPGTQVDLDPVATIIARRAAWIESPFVGTLDTRTGYPTWQPQIVIKARREALNYYALRWQRVMRGNVIGPDGPTFRFSNAMPDAVREAWQEFEQAADVTGVSLASSLGMAYQSYKRDGDALTIMAPDPSTGQLRLQQLDALATRNVNVDNYGRITDFELVDDVRVLPPDTLYWWEPEYTGYYRGYPKILMACSALKRSYQYGVWYEADAHLTATLRAILKVKYAGAQSAQSEAQVTARAREMIAAGDTRTEAEIVLALRVAEANAYQQMQPGQVMHVYDDVAAVDGLSGSGMIPTQNLAVAHKHFMSEAAAALEISPAALTGDHEAGVYSSHRQTRLDDVRTYQTEQHPLKSHCLRLWKRWAQAERERGMAVDDRWLEKVDTVGHPGIDPNKDAAFYAKMIELALMSRAEVTAELGSSWVDEVWPQIQAEMDLMREVVDQNDAAVEGADA